MSTAPFTLDGRKVLVTGGTKGIGRAIATVLAGAGATVIANYAHDEEAAESLARHAASENLPITLCRADLTTPVGHARLLDSAGSQIHGLVHCAATGIHRPVTELTSRHWDFTFALNLKAFFELVRDLVPAFAKGSSVVALSSEGAVHAVPYYTLVGSSKAGLEALCRHLSVELAPRGIRVNVLAPGSVATAAWDALPDRDARLGAAAARAPRGRLTTVEEVASAAQFLMSDAAAGISGHTLVVDGGERLRS